MLNLLERALNAQLVVSLLVILLASIFVGFKSIPPETWKDVVNTVVLAFVGGGLVKEGLAQIGNRQNPPT